LAAENSDLSLNDEVLLPVADHTRAKHRILTEYMNAWFPIIGQTAGRIIYLDGFAGSGDYVDGSHGSPVIAIECAKNHVLKAKMSCEMVFLFTEIHKGRYEHLRQLLERLYGKWDEKTETFQGLPSNYKFGLTHGDFNEVTKGILKELEENGENLAPTMAFIDPFGYELDLNLLARILKFRRCELLVTYMAGFIDRFASETKHRESIKRTLQVTDADLDKVSSNPNVRERELIWLRYFNDAIVSTAESLSTTPVQIYRLYFKMLDLNNHTLYYLVYFTKSPKGIGAMKRAMQKVGRDWSYRFSDHDFDPSQNTILNYLDEQPWIRDEAEAIAKRFAGKEVSVEDVDSYILLETIWVPRKGCLKMLAEEGRLDTVKGGQKKNTFPPGSVVRFH
jgi:three-Cys-motif partner protein